MTLTNAVTRSLSILLFVALSGAMSPFYCAKADAASSPGLRAAKATALLDGPVGTMARAVAVCPKGTSVLSGGWRTRSPKLNGAVSVEESLRQGSRSWRVSGHIAVAGDVDRPHKLIAHATCRPGKAPTAVREFAQRTAGAGLGTVDLEASCPAGRYAVAGGFATSLPSGAITGSYRIGGTRWRTQVSVPVDGPATQVPLRTVAYCVRSRPGPVKVDSRPVAVTGDDYQETETNFCRRGGYLGSGGYRIIGDELSVGELRLPKYSYGAVHLRWGVLIRIVGDQTFDLKTFSYCLRR